MTRFSSNTGRCAAILLAVLCAPASTLGAGALLLAGTPLPADSGAAGLQTLGGIDANGNAVRDDMEIFLQQYFSKKPKVLRAMSNLIIGVQATMTATTLAQSSRAQSMTIRATECLQAVKDQVTADDVRDEKMIALLVNTPARTAAIAAHRSRIAEQMFAMRELAQWEPMCELRADLVDNAAPAAPRRE